MRAQVFHEHVMPFHKNLYPEAEIETFCIMREPIDWLYSWYRFRSRDELARIAKLPEHSHKAAMVCGHVSFEEFIIEVLKGSDAQKFAKVGSQSKYILLDDEKLGVDRIFRYEDGLTDVEDFLSNKIGQQIQIPHKNKSPEKKRIKLSNELIEKLQLHLDKDFELYEGRNKQSSLAV